jgi:hypothetical protein
MKSMNLKNSIAGLVFLLSIEGAYAQIIRAGIKAGPQFSWVTVDDPKFNSVAEVHPMAGFHAGLVLLLK